MIFGKIDYLNLLPFHVFLKRFRAQNAFKQGAKKGTPSKLCADLRASRVDAAVISSIEARHYKRLNMGICAKGAVISVLAKKNTSAKNDPASRSSNMLARILGLNNEIIIGDRALKAYLNSALEFQNNKANFGIPNVTPNSVEFQNKKSSFGIPKYLEFQTHKKPLAQNDFYDLAELWGQKTGLPFVFGHFACKKNKKYYEKIIKLFLKQKIKIPRYILNSYAKSRGIPAQAILWYLNFIYYKITPKEQKALSIFINSARALHFKA